MLVSQSLQNYNINTAFLLQIYLVNAKLRHRSQVLIEMINEVVLLVWVQNEQISVKWKGYLAASEMRKLKSSLFNMVYLLLNSKLRLSFRGNNSCSSENTSWLESSLHTIKTVMINTNCQSIINLKHHGFNSTWVLRVIETF